MTTEATQELLRQLCADLRMLWTEAGGPTLRTLSVRVRLGKSQVGNILNGQIRRPPDWQVIEGLVNSFVRYAREHGRADRLSLATAVEQFWRPRHAMVEHAFRQVHRTGPPVAAGQANRDNPPGADGSAGPAVSRPVPGHPVPRQLPGAVRHFVGRAAELGALTALLDETADAAGTAVILAVGGTAGIGKTALAVTWAQRVADRFPDGQLYVNLRGFDPTWWPMEPAEVVRGFLDALGVPRGQIPTSMHAQIGLYRSLLAGRRVLVILDNARDIEQVRPLLPGAPGCVAVVTSRSRLDGLVAAEGAYPLVLDLLSTNQAWELLARRLGADRLVAEPAAVEEIIGRCAGLPLALAVVAARAATHAGFSLAALAAELSDARAALPALNGGEASSDLRAVFSWSYQQLTARAARLFRLLGVHPGPDLAAPAAASLAGVTLPAVGALLTELTHASLITEHLPGRYSFHDLLRAYARNLADELDSAQARRAAVARLLDHYVATADRAAWLVLPGREAITVAAPGPGVTVAAPADRAAALTWFTAERRTLLAAVAMADTAGFEIRACELATGLVGFLDLRGHWEDLAASQHVALAAAERLDDPAWQARVHRNLGGAYAWMDRNDESEAHFNLALQRYAEIGDVAGCARSHRGICLTLERQGRFEAALDHARRSRDLFLRTDDRAGQAYAFNSVGWYHALVGDFQAALRECRQAITLLRETGDRAGEATTWDSLGYAHHHLGEHNQAVACYRRALDMLAETGDRYFQAPTLDHLGDTFLVLGDRVAARDAWRQALAILTDLRRPEAAEVQAKLHRLEGPVGAPSRPPLPHLSSA